ncbi:778_t:CDS:2, partial [Funneliformis geosporum]
MNDVLAQFEVSTLFAFGAHGSSIRGKEGMRGRRRRRCRCRRSDGGESRCRNQSFEADLPKNSIISIQRAPTDRSLGGSYAFNKTVCNKNGTHCCIVIIVI